MLPLALFLFLLLFTTPLTALAGSGCLCVFGPRCQVPHPEASRTSCYDTCLNGGLVVGAGQSCSLTSSPEPQAYFDGTLLTASSGSGGTSGGTGSTGSPAPPAPVSSQVPPAPSSSGSGSSGSSTNYPCPKECVDQTFCFAGTCSTVYRQCAPSLIGGCKLTQTTTGTSLAMNLKMTDTTSFFCKEKYFDCYMIDQDFWFSLRFLTGATIPTNSLDLLSVPFALQTDNDEHCVMVRELNGQQVIEHSMCESVVESVMFNLVANPDGTYLLQDTYSKLCVSARQIGSDYAMDSCSTNPIRWKINFSGISVSLPTNALSSTTSAPTPTSTSATQSTQPSSQAQNVPSSASSSLSPGAVAGVVVAVVAVLAAVGLGAFKLYLNNRRASAPIIVTGLTDSELNYVPPPLVPVGTEEGPPSPSMPRPSFRQTPMPRPPSYSEAVFGV